MFNKKCCKERQIEGTSGRELRALAGAAVIVSVLGAERGAGVGEAAGPTRCATEALGVKAAVWKSKSFEGKAPPEALVLII